MVSRFSGGFGLASWKAMAHSRFIPEEICPFHITARTNNQEPFPVSLEETWKIMEDYLHFIHHAFEVRVHAFVLMNNHFHLIATFPAFNLSPAMAYFMRETSRSLQNLSGNQNHVWGSRFYSSAILNHHYYLNAYKYVYQNPVRAAACDRPEEYEFSTLRGLMGRTRLAIPIEEDLTLFSDFEGTLLWLATPACPQDSIAFRKALGKRICKVPVDRETGKISRLEAELL
jgi:REP element-mobilizing transposase RayT